MKNKNKLELVLEVLEAINEVHDQATDGRDRHLAALHFNSLEKKMLNIMAITPKSDVLHKVMAKIYNLHVHSLSVELDKELAEIRRNKVMSAGGEL